MSTFCGTFEEIRGISADRFVGSNRESSVFFLSHCHSDHMIGLFDSDFQQELLARDGVFLYASPVTVCILKCWTRGLRDKLREIPIGIPTTIAVTPDRNMTVTLIPAGHCPGSVMFLFETDSQRVLYTGDYRIPPRDLKKCKHFYWMDQVKKIDTLYLDTTFLQESHAHFPSREKTIEVACKAITEWTSQSNKHAVELVTGATHAYENLFCGIYNRLKIPLYLTYNPEFLQYIPEMDKVITSIPSDTKIFVSRRASQCGTLSKGLIMKSIRISALKWKHLRQDSEGYNEAGICFATHASASEIKEFVTFLKPEKIHPCVLPNNLPERREMHRLLEEMMATYKKSVENLGNNLFDTDDVEIDGIQEVRMVRKQLNESSLLSSPTQEFKRRRDI